MDAFDGMHSVRSGLKGNVSARSPGRNGSAPRFRQNGESHTITISAEPEDFPDSERRGVTQYMFIVKGEADASQTGSIDRVVKVYDFTVVSGTTTFIGSDQFTIHGPVAYAWAGRDSYTLTLDGQPVTTEEIVSQTGGSGIDIPTELPSPEGPEPPDDGGGNGDGSSGNVNLFELALAAGAGGLAAKLLSG